jgi:DNA polymerase-3 subunit gamma/tau
VRDALSLLDQAIVQAERGQVVGAEIVRDMLGLADRAATIQLFEQVVRGETGPALESFKSLWGFGADPAQVMLDLLEHCHGASISKAVGPDALTLPKDQASRLAGVGAQASAGTLSRLWQMLLKAHGEVRQAPDPAAAAEMAIIRLCYAADLPGPEEALKALRDGEPVGGGGGGGGSVPSGGGGGGVTAAARSMAAPQPASQPAPTLASFEDVVVLIDARRDVRLKLDIDQYLRLINYRPGVITFEPAPGAPADLAGRLIARLKEWTGQPWLVAAEGGGGAESAWERQKREERETRAQIEADPFVRSVLEAFPGAKVVEVRQLTAPEAPADAPVEEDEE